MPSAPNEAKYNRLIGGTSCGAGPPLLGLCMNAASCSTPKGASSSSAEFAAHVRRPGHHPASRAPATLAFHRRSRQTFRINQWRL